MTINERINALRQQMAQHDLAAYIIPSSDPHQSEYVASHWKVRQWISNFTGSAGIVIVTPNHAGLWTDSRYFIQAEKELADNDVELHKLKVPHTPEYIEWLLEHIPAGKRIGCDGSLFSINQFRHLTKSLYQKDIELNHQLDFFPDIWADRPALPLGKAFELSEKLCGESRASKLQRVKDQMTKQGASDHLISELGDIAWLLNVRCDDIEFNPVLISYLHLSQGLAHLFVAEEKINDSLRAALKADGVLIKPYAAINDFLQQLGKDHKILIDPTSTSISLFQCLEEEQVIRASNPAALMKAIKNPTEVSHIKEAMIKDGIALTQLYSWLEKELTKGPLSEVDVANKLDECRKAQGDYQGESFPAIVGYGENGAIVHYRPTEEYCAQLQPEGILLLDSGGQYLQGTTDITRTTALSTPTPEQKRNFTLVLKGHINVARLKFPHGTRGNQMDILARQALWEYGLDYGHGTGHGVGFFLNVHEGPQSISGGLTGKASTIFQTGMFTSNEPGYYKPGEYGIRIENLVLCVENQNTEHGRFLQFETMTLFPIDLTLVDASLLTPVEKEWLDHYHQKVYAQLAPRLNEEEQEWLRKKISTPYNS